MILSSAPRPSIVISPHAPTTKQLDRPCPHIMSVHLSGSSQSVGVSTLSSRREVGAELTDVCARLIGEL